MIIIIHPGSLNLRIGRASDINPHRILNAIARRRKPQGKVYRDTVLPGTVINSKELVQELEECRLQISHTLQSCLQSDGRRRYATPPQQISAFNRRSSPEFLDLKVNAFYNPNDLDVVIGDDVIKLNPNGDFNLHFPIRRGDFNLHGGVGGSVTAVLADLQEMWEYVLRKHLKIPLSELHLYKAVLIVPDIYNRGHLRELMNILLMKMGFGSCFLVQVGFFISFASKSFKQGIFDRFRIMWQRHSVQDWDMRALLMLAIRKLRCPVLKMEFHIPVQGYDRIATILRSIFH